MKTLYLLRHSKAGHTHKKILDDHDRPLTDKGIRYCQNIAHYLRTTHTAIPESVLCSTADRAKETWNHTLSHLELSIPVTYLPTLYLASSETLLKTLQHADESFHSLLIVGHNPGLHLFAQMLAGSGDKKKFRSLKNGFPPPSLAIFTFKDDHWFTITERTGNLEDFFTPKKTMEY